MSCLLCCMIIKLKDHSKYWENTGKDSLGMTVLTKRQLSRSIYSLIFSIRFVWYSSSTEWSYCLKFIVLIAFSCRVDNFSRRHWTMWERKRKRERKRDRERQRQRQWRRQRSWFICLLTFFIDLFAYRRFVSSAKYSFWLCLTDLWRSLMKMINNSGPNTDP